MNVNLCRSEAERLWWLHRENCYWLDEIRAKLLINLVSIKAKLKKQEPNSKEFREGINNLKKTILIWKDLNEAYRWESFEGVDMRKVSVLWEIERLKSNKD